MDSQPARSASSSRGAAAGWAMARVVLFGIGGIGSGLLSCRVMTIGDLATHTSIWVSGPGLVYGIFWLVAAWIPGALSVRDRIRHSWAWSLAFFSGITISYVGAYYVAFFAYNYMYAYDWGFDFPENFAIQGILGGLLGSFGLVSCWSILFPAADSWLAKCALTALGAVLGAALIFWDLNEPEFRTLCLFFAIWQGGMAMAFSAIDGAGRSE